MGGLQRSTGERSLDSREQPEAAAGELSAAFSGLFLPYDSRDRNCLCARFYDLSIDPKLLMHLLPLS